jgi:hypothetical protein
MVFEVDRDEAAGSSERPPSAEHLRELAMQAQYHRDRHRLYAARVGGSRPVSQSKLRDLKRKREVAEAHLRRAKESRSGSLPSDEGS